MSQRSCRVCGRRFVPAAHEGDRAHATHCSDACRERRVGALDRSLEAAILSLAAERGGRTICPSEAARRVDPANWRGLMPLCHMAVRRLHAQGRVVVLQRGKPIDPDQARGPVRLAKL